MHHKTAESPAHTGAAPETTGATIRWWAPAYDAMAWVCTLGQEKNIRAATLKAAALQPGEKVLDVGCGTGTLAVAAWRKVRPEGEVTGVDASPEMVELARRKAKKNGAGAQFKVAPIEGLPFPDGSFDAVLSTFMLHHLPDDLKEKGFAEVHRVLKPGGRLVAVDLSGNKKSFLSRFMALVGHSMPSDYEERLIAGMKDARFAEVAERKTRFDYLAFITARKGS
jgi:ubiquinone/menaquinone biosynthesis C-methylase UbiE